MCPNCRRLVSIDESTCPYCGLHNPGSRWKNNFFTRGILGGDQFLRYIVIANAAMFILSILINPGSTGFSMNPFGFLSPGGRSLMLLGATGRIPLDEYHRWWTVLTASYLHGGILHIFFNMMALQQIGPLIVQEYGVSRTFCIYTLGGVGGYTLSYLAGVPMTIGASAAVCGLIGSALYYGKSRGGYFGQAVYRQVGGWVIALFIFGFLFPGIDNWAHGGGLLCGILAGAILGYEEKVRENFMHKALAGGCVLVTMAALAWAVGTAFLLLLLTRRPL